MFVVFDMDGTLADDSERLPLILNKPKDWDAYHAGMSGDLPIMPMIQLMRALCRDTTMRVEVWTGRPERFRAVSFSWFVEHLGAGYRFRLRMRPDGNMNPVHEVKGVWLAGLRVLGDLPDMIYDDRPPSIAFFREQGIYTVAVAHPTPESWSGGSPDEAPK